MKCEDLDNFIVDYVEGDLTLDHKQEFDRHLAQCPKCRTAFEYYKQVIKGLQTIPKEKCPETLIEKILTSVPVTYRRPSVFMGILQRISHRPIWQMRYVAAAALIIICVFIYLPDHKKQDHIQPTYSMAEIRQADEQMRLALNYIAHCYDRTQDAIEDNIIPNYVVKPIKSSMTSALNEIINGG